MSSHFTLIAAVLLVLIAGCSATSDIEGITQEAYAGTQHAAFIDLAGASDISVRFTSDMDTSDRWFMFQISHEDFVSLVQSVAQDNQGPRKITWAESANIPKVWQTQHSRPPWWNISPTKDFKAISWCHGTRPTYHHGWYFYHDGRTDRALCWHWRYQHGGEMCEP